MGALYVIYPSITTYISHIHGYTQQPKFRPHVPYALVSQGLIYGNRRKLGKNFSLASAINGARSMTGSELMPWFW
jgi:hypothetical protein